MNGITATPGTDATHHTAEPITAAGSNPHYRWYVLALLWLVAVLRFVDLQIFAVLLEPIRREMALTDTQLALLGGLAFAVFYATLGLPIAWLADRSNRRNIIAGAVTLWSLMTVLCGQAGSFAALFLARMGVGVGEAGAYPPTTSLLADYFPAGLRARACAVLASAIPAGVCVGFLVGGLVAQHWGWRAAFSVVGLPGIVAGLVVLLTLREAPRSVDPAARSETMRDGLRVLWASRAYRHVVTATCLFTLGAAGSGVWMPSFFMRQHGFDSAQVGAWMALLYGAGGLCGALGGGWLSQHLANTRGGNAWHARVCAWSLAGTMPLLPFLFLHPSPGAALVFLGMMTTLMHMNSGPVLALVQTLGGCRRRALAHAFSMLVTNLVALPLGPLFVGLCSDIFSPRFGSSVLGLAMLALLLLAWAGAVLYFLRAASWLGRPIAGNTAGNYSNPDFSPEA
jgi:predicted MFS family arabinose efflux permease